MDGAAVLAAVEGSAVAEGLRFSRWSYAVLSAAHVLGIALLVGAIAPLDLRLLGLWRQVPVDALSAVLVPTAAAGLALAALTGALLFSVRASEYAAVGVFRWKLAFVAAGLAGALALQAAARRGLAGVPPVRRAAHGALSLFAWGGALLLGRLIAFADG